jgi:ubiquinone/menaquinone biosynthesis C-methylase UbiE
MDETIYERRRTSFGPMATTYDRYRPGWPAPVAAWLTGAEPGGPLEGRAALDVLDLGAGTGKLTRTLAGMGHRVTAVDPSEGMLAVLGASLPQIATRVGTGEQIPLPDSCVDAVTVAQAWHWMRPGEAGAECARVLRPGGVLGLGWNARSGELPWLRELDELIRDEANLHRREVREQAGK